MKNNIILLSAILLSGLASAQIGVNSPDPKATLDITAKSSTGTSRAIDGLLIPRVDRQRAQNMTNIPVSTLIYVNDITTGTQSDIAVAIDYPGYYYFDGTLWIKLNPNISGIDQDNNIYNTDGTLDTNRLVEQNDKTLAFTGTAVNAFSVDGSTLSVDAANNRVGIGTLAPNSLFQVVGGEARIGGPSSQTGTLADPILRIHSNANKEGAGGALWFNENNTDYGYYLKHNTSGGTTNGKDGLSIGTKGNVPYNPAKPGIFISDYQKIGFGTSTPQQVFHIDAARDNDIFKEPTADQQKNDVVMTEQGSMGIGITEPNESAILDLSTTDKGFLPPRLTTAQRDLIKTKTAGLMVYNITTNCLEFWNASKWVSTCAAVAPIVGTVSQLVCSNPVNSGTLTAGTAASITSKISYIGGNGGAHDGQTVSSTGVTGLTATLNPANFTNGDGELTYFITGTPSASGTAVFALFVGGKGCNLSIPVSAKAAVVSDLLCGTPTNNGTLTGGVAASGVSSVISYTGGNGGAYEAQTVASTGVTGLTANLLKGDVNNGTGGFFTFTITGTPSSAGTANFAITIGGKSCTFSRTVNAPAGTVGNLNCGGTVLNGTLKNNTVVAPGVTLSIPYTGGNGGSYANQSIPSTGVPGLVATLVANNFNVGSGTLVYNITGTPLGEGTAYFDINIGGRSCPAVAVTVNVLQESDVNCAAGSNDVYPYPNVNTKYIRCITLSGGATYKYIYTCPTGSLYIPSAKKCVLQP
jgi:hypothetical protein